VILRDGRPVGRLYVARLDEEIRIVDITVLPGERNAGIGSQLLSDLMADASNTAKALRVYVESFNPSIKPFERLGFIRKEEQGIYILMEWVSDQLKNG